jgi:hypothetical protein
MSTVADAWTVGIHPDIFAAMSLRMPRRCLLSLALLAFSVTALPAAQAWPRYKFATPLKVQFPARHPYLALTPQRSEHALPDGAGTGCAGRGIRSVRMEKSGMVIHSAAGTKRVPVEYRLIPP